MLAGRCNRGGSVCPLGTVFALSRNVLGGKKKEKEKFLVAIFIVTSVIPLPRARQESKGRGRGVGGGGRTTGRHHGSSVDILGGIMARRFPLIVNVYLLSLARHLRFSSKFSNGAFFFSLESRERDEPFLTGRRPVGPQRKGPVGVRSHYSSQRAPPSTPSA